MLMENGLDGVANKATEIERDEEEDLTPGIPL
jgi:hypothetical protein